jgi:hypothetical protein
MLAMKARQVAEDEQRRPCLVYDRDRGNIECAIGKLGTFHILPRF